jgi:hypothetical protein
MGVVQAARELGLAVPRDLSVGGFDDGALSLPLQNDKLFDKVVAGDSII